MFLRIFLHLVFRISFIIWTLLICVGLFPLIFISQKTVLKIRKIWAHGTIFLLEKIQNVKLEFKGLENLPKNGEPVIFASKHQSAFETVAFCVILNQPIYILKKELSQIPIFGSYIKRSGMIIINRSLGASIIKKLISESIKVFESKRDLVIFPEGTRTEPGKSGKYQSGVAALYLRCPQNIIPVATNSGCFWPKNFKFSKYQPKKCIIEFLPPINKKLEKQEFMSLLYSQIESKSLEVLK